MSLQNLQADVLQQASAAYFHIHILVVEDSSELRELIAEFLQGMGYSVIGVPHASEALELINKGVYFDLVITDIIMPNMNGYDFAVHLRQNTSGYEVPVYFRLPNRHQTPIR